MAWAGTGRRVRPERRSIRKMIDLTIYEEQRRRAVQRARERNILIPTFAQMRNPALIPARIKQQLKARRPVGRGLAQPVPHHLEERARGSRGRLWRGELPGAAPGAHRRAERASSRWWASGSPPARTRSARAFGCLVPRLVTGQFDPTSQKAVWPSTGNYCRGGAYDSALLACESIAILPEGMSRERFEWLATVCRRGHRHAGLREQRQGDLRQVLGAAPDARRRHRHLQPVRRVRQPPLALRRHRPRHGGGAGAGDGAAGQLPRRGADHRLGGHHRLRRLPEGGLSHEQGRRQRGAAVPDAAA